MCCLSCNPAGGGRRSFAVMIGSGLPVEQPAQVRARAGVVLMLWWSAMLLVHAVFEEVASIWMRAWYMVVSTLASLPAQMC